MRQIRYAVAMSLDGYIARPNGEYDWIGADEEVDFAAFWAQFDTLLMGRRTYELATKSTRRVGLRRNNEHHFLTNFETARSPRSDCGA